MFLVFTRNFRNSQNCRKLRKYPEFWEMSGQVEAICDVRKSTSTTTHKQKIWQNPLSPSPQVAAKTKLKDAETKVEVAKTKITIAKKKRRNDFFDIGLNGLP